MKTKYTNFAIFTFFFRPPSVLPTENLQNQFFFRIFNFTFGRNFTSKLKIIKLNYKIEKP